jgi:hypothetical protein
MVSRGKSVVVEAQHSPPLRYGSAGNITLDELREDSQGSRRPCRRRCERTTTPMTPRRSSESCRARFHISSRSDPGRILSSPTSSTAIRRRHGAYAQAKNARRDRPLNPFAAAVQATSVLALVHRRTAAAMKDRLRRLADEHCASAGEQRQRRR